MYRLWDAQEHARAAEELLAFVGSETRMAFSPTEIHSDDAVKAIPTMIAALTHASLAHAIAAIVAVDLTLDDKASQWRPS